jgi:hypothetical protein
VVSVSVVLQRDRLPTAEAWQRTIDELGLPLRLDPDVDTASHEGMWPVTLKGEGTGFEYFIDHDPDPPEGQPDSNTVPDAVCVTLISRSALEGRAAIAAAAALAAVSGGRVHDDAEPRVYDRRAALLWARQVVAEEDTVDTAAHRTASRRSWTARIRRAVMDRLDPPSVTADWDSDDLLGIKIQTAQIEINISVPRSELGQLERVPSTGDRALRIGTILEAPAWWIISREEDLLFIVAGHDDETWEVGASLPPAALEEILAEVAAAVARG